MRLRVMGGFTGRQHVLRAAFALGCICIRLSLLLLGCFVCCCSVAVQASGACGMHCKTVPGALRRSVAVHSPATPQA